MTLIQIHVNGYAAPKIYLQPNEEETIFERVRIHGVSLSRLSNRFLAGRFPNRWRWILTK